MGFDQGAVQEIDGQDISPELVTTEELITTNNFARIEKDTDIQSISSGSNAIVTMDTVAAEDTRVLDASASNNRIRAKKAGTHLVIASVKWNSDSGWSTGDIARAGIVVNGTTKYDAVNVKSGVGDEGVQASAIIDLSADDDLKSEVFQNSGASKLVQGKGDQTNLIVGRLG